MIFGKLSGSEVHEKRHIGVVICLPTASWRLALAASRLMIPPIPHGPLPWAVAKKFHSAGIPNYIIIIIYNIYKYTK